MYTIYNVTIFHQWKCSKIDKPNDNIKLIRRVNEKDVWKQQVKNNYVYNFSGNIGNVILPETIYYFKIELLLNQFHHQIMFLPKTNVKTISYDTKFYLTDSINIFNYLYTTWNIFNKLE